MEAINTPTGTMSALEFWYNTKPPKTRKIIREAVIKKCDIGESQFYKWLGKKFAPPLAQNIISEITGIQKEKLYTQVTFLI